MTVEELKMVRGTKAYSCSSGASLFSVCRAIYNSDAENYRNILKVLNPLAQWTNLQPGTVIEYIDKDSVMFVY